MVLTPQSSFGTVHYAEAWCLVYFLIEHKKYKSRFLSFFSDLATGMGLNEVVIPAQQGGGRNVSYIKPLDMLELFKKKMGLPVLTELEREYLEFIYYGLPEVGSKGYVASARIKMRDHDFVGALEDLKAAMEAGSLDPNCFLHSARIHAMKARYETAAVDYMRAIERDPLNPDYHLEVGVALRASEDALMMEEGLRHIYLATEIAPDEPYFTTTLAKALSGEDLIELRKIKERLKAGKGAGRRKDGGQGMHGENKKPEGG
jgi:tetratricopeptide (TPR) repeat protein